MNAALLAAADRSGGQRRVSRVLLCQCLQYLTGFLTELGACCHFCGVSGLPVSDSPALDNGICSHAWFLSGHQ